jgi:hypothetical protein
MMYLDSASTIIETVVADHIILGVVGALECMLYPDSSWSKSNAPNHSEDDMIGDDGFDDGVVIEQD